MILGWTSSKIVLMVILGWITRSRVTGEQSRALFLPVRLILCCHVYKVLYVCMLHINICLEEHLQGVHGVVCCCSGVGAYGRAGEGVGPRAVGGWPVPGPLPRPHTEVQPARDQHCTPTDTPAAGRYVMKISHLFINMYLVFDGITFVW